MNSRSGGIRRIYRHVDILNRNNIDAYVLHKEEGFKISDMPNVPIRYIDQVNFSAKDVIVIPEGYPNVMYQLRNSKARRFSIALNWDYIFNDMAPDMDWRDFNIERALVVSPYIQKFIQWSMGIPVSLISDSIDSELYFGAAKKEKKVVYLESKSQDIVVLKRILKSRNSSYVDEIKWVGLSQLTQEEYAAQIRGASIFLNLSKAEGIVHSSLEAMRSNTLVAGYTSISGRDHFVQGDGFNSVIVETGDYVQLSYKIESYLKDILNEQTNKWRPILRRARKLTDKFTPENEEKDLISFWKKFHVHQTVDKVEKVSLILPSFNRCHTLIKNLECLENQTFPINKMEVIIVDDHSTDSSWDMLKNYDGPLDLICEKNPFGAPDKYGYISCQNHGLSLSKNELCIFLDDDLLPIPTLVEEHVKTHNDWLLKGEEVVCRGWRTEEHDFDDLYRYSLEEDSQFNWKLRYYIENENDICPNMCAGNNISLLRYNAEKVGGFGDDFYRYGQDLRVPSKCSKFLKMRCVANVNAYGSHRPDSRDSGTKSGRVYDIVERVPENKVLCILKVIDNLHPIEKKDLIIKLIQEALNICKYELPENQEIYQIVESIEVPG